MQHVIAVLVAFAPRGQWVCLNQIRENLKANEITMDNLEEDEAIFRFKQQWIYPLVAMGWLELGKTGQLQEWVRWVISIDVTNTGHRTQESRENEVVVQPNFEIIAPLTLSFQNRWELECFAEHVQTDQVSRYVLTKDSLNRACENGRTIEEITGYLNQYGKYGVPENVEITLVQWGKQFEVEGLEKPPLYPRWGTIEDTELFVWPKEASKKGILYPGFDLGYYEEVNKLPEIEDMYDNLAEIPTIWLKNNREYHVSVRREIITKAIELKTCIRLRENDQLRTIIPKEIVHHHGLWSVHCFLDGCQKQLSPDDLKSLQLILPGINDSLE